MSTNRSHEEGNGPMKEEKNGTGEETRTINSHLDLEKVIEAKWSFSRMIPTLPLAFKKCKILD
jgi:hypothetical protein